MGEIREGISIYIKEVIATFLIFGLIVALNMAGLIALPTFLTLERTAYKNSYQYTDAKEKELLTFVTEYNDLETKKQEYIVGNTNRTYDKIIDNLEIQQKVLADKIRNEAEMVPDQNELPKSVRQFLRDYPR